MKKAFLILALMAVCVQSAFAYNYYYYLGEFVQVEEFGEVINKPPVGVVGLVDLTPPNGNGDSVVFMASTQELTDGTLLLHGDIAEDVIDDSVLDKWESKTGYRPEGTTLLDLLWNTLTVGSDPLGETRAKPLMPTMQMVLELHLGGHSLIKSEKFIYGSSPHTAKVKTVLQNEYKKMRTDDIINGSKNYLKVLDLWGEKYNVKNPENEFIPEGIKKEIPIKHETIVTEDWNCSNSGNPSCDLTWVDVAGTDLDIVSNALSDVGNSTAMTVQTTSEVSGNDNYAQVDMNLSNSTSNLGIVVCRMASGAVTGYSLRRTNGGEYRIEKVVTGTSTSLSADTLAFSMPETWKIESNGSTITTYLAGVQKLQVTDTSISSGVLGGIRHYRTGTQANSFDNFEFGDVEAATRNRMIMIY